MPVMLHQRRSGRFFAMLALSWLFAAISFSPASAEGDPDSVKEPLSDMGWYDRAKDDYRKIDPEELKQRAPSSGPGLPAIPAEMLVYGVLAAFAVLILWLLVQAARNRIRKSKTTPTVALSEEVETFITSEKNAVDMSRVASLFLQNFRSGDMEKAAVFLYLTYLDYFSKKGLLELHESITPREYLRRLRKAEGTTYQDTFAPCVRVYEAAVYGRTLPSPEKVKEIARNLPDSPFGDL